MECTCKCCQSDFELILKKQTQKGIVIRYYVCPHCHTPYIVTCLDEELKEMLGNNQIALSEIQAKKDDLKEEIDLSQLT